MTLYRMLLIRDFPKLLCTQLGTVSISFKAKNPQILAAANLSTFMSFSAVESVPV